MASLWGESTQKRIWEDTKSWLKNHIVAWFLAFLVPVGASVMVTLFIPPTMDFRLAALWGLMGGFAGLAVLVGGTCGIQSILVFKKQRDEARELYEPIKELANIKSGDTIKEKDINVSLMFEQLKSKHLANVTFEHCVLRGPCTIALKNNNFHGCDFGSNFADRLIKGETGKQYFGMGVFVHCKFNFCEFANISFLLLEEEIKRFLSKVVKV